MWAHYGARAKGYVVCFNHLDQEFSGDATGSLNTLKPVQYVKEFVGMTRYYVSSGPRKIERFQLLSDIFSGWETPSSLSAFAASIGS
jgi:hypothetical protein